MLARLPSGVNGDFGDQVKGRIIVGAYGLYMQEMLARYGSSLPVDREMIRPGDGWLTALRVRRRSLEEVDS